MRLWHEKLITELPRQQLLGQHRECCALRGLGWHKKHATVNYVFQYSPYKLYQYHMKVIKEMKQRGYLNNPLWEDSAYRGSNCAPYSDVSIVKEDETRPIYPEHDTDYLEACLYNLASKGIHLSFEVND